MAFSDYGFHSVECVGYAVKAGPDGHRRVKCQHKAKKPNVYNVHIKYIINDIKHKATLVCPNAAVVHL